MKAALLYPNFLDRDGKKRTVGGVQTYLLNLAQLCQEMEIEPTIYQRANRPFETHQEEIRIVGIPVSGLRGSVMQHQVFAAAIQNLSYAKDLVIFGTIHLAVKCGWKRAISIQHGISWDLPGRFLTNRGIFHHGRMGAIYKHWLHRHFIQQYERCANRVCVDYNFLNWYRTFLGSEPQGNNWVIPNFTRAASEDQLLQRDNDQKTIKILFARRFFEYRGTRIMAKAAKNILAEFSSVEFTFAGEGPDEEWLRKTFAKEPRIHFIKYPPEDSIDVHLLHHIAVVPSLASEGTSFSVGEAMGAGCAVVATNIGGITNMIIDGYNGRLVFPSAHELSAALKQLLETPQLRKKLGTNAYLTASQGFNIESWKSQWRSVIESF